MGASERFREEEQSRVDADQAWELSRKVQDAEYVLLSERQRQRQKKLRQGFILTLGSSSLALMALLGSTFQMRRAAYSLTASNRERRENELMILSLFEAGPEAILIVDHEGRIVRMNPEAERLFGYSAEEIARQPFNFLIPDGWHERYEEFRRNPSMQADHLPQGKRLELPMKRKDLGAFFASVSIGRTESGRGMLEIAFVSDVSARQAHEQALKTQAEQLRIVTSKLLTAQEDERRRIARNLHDDLNQSLAYLAMGLGNLANQAWSRETEIELKALRAKARESAELVRTISHQLHPAVLDDLGLEEAIHDLGSEFEQRTGVGVAIECAEIPQGASQDAIACLYYVVTECLRNVAKHAQAATVEIQIAHDQNALRMSISDDGRGMSADPNRVESGIGITTMRERLYLLGGTLSISPRRPQGTVVDVRLPV